MMTSTPESSGYRHTQRAPLCWLLYAGGVVCLFLAWVIDAGTASVLLVCVGLSLALTATAFHHLTVEDVGQALLIRFGPVPTFRRTVPYHRIVRAEVGRTTILDGWGIHYSLRGGWVWNIWGRDCVVLHLNPGVLRIGTDDTPRLAEFLKGRLSQEPR